MTSLLNALLQITNFSPAPAPGLNGSSTTPTGSPFLSTLVPAAASSLAVQLAFGIPGVIRHSDFFYDLSGGISFYATLATGFFVPVLRTRLLLAGEKGEAAGDGQGGRGSLLGLLLELNGERDWRQVTMTGRVLVYAVRLSTYLFTRILTRGHDSRFDRTKHNPRRFMVFWLVQAVWVILCCMPVLAVNAIPASTLKSLPPGSTATDKLGTILFLFGFGVECVADYQKSKWWRDKSKKLHDEQFITRGLWGRSRYPNYFGDITLWTGMATTAAGILVREPVQATLGWNGGVAGHLRAVLLPFCAPAFVSWALLRASGVPLSEKKYDMLYGGRKDYQEWRNNTPLLIPKIW